ncbi:MAG: LPXTG cell wall anchor domain-containing protein [Candidatus Dojkabacteria bacterium]
MNTFRKRFLIAGILVGGFFLFGSTTKAEAQSFTLSPASGSITVSGTQVVQIIATNPPATNAASIRITVPTSLMTITGYTDGAGTLTLLGAGCSGGKYTASQVCVDLAVLGGGNITNGEVIGSFTLTGVADGLANANFVAGNKYVGGSDFTGVGGTYTIGAGGGAPVDGGGATNQTLPTTGVFDDKNFLWYGLTLVSGGFLVYAFNKNRNKRVLQHSMIDHFFEKNRLE